MAISPSGRSDVYWVDGVLRVGDGCGLTGGSTPARNQPRRATRKSNSWNLNTSKNPVKVTVKTESDGNDAIDIREYQQTKWRGQNPTKHGVCLTLEEYKRLKELSKKIEKELEENLKIDLEDESKGEEITGMHMLSSDHIVRVGVFVSGKHKRMGVDFHEFKKKEKVHGEFKLVGKGLIMSKDDWDTFKKIMPEMESKEGLDV